MGVDYSYHLVMGFPITREQAAKALKVNPADVMVDDLDTLCHRCDCRHVTSGNAYSGNEEWHLTVLKADTIHRDGIDVLWMKAAKVHLILKEHYGIDVPEPTIYAIGHIW